MLINLIARTNGVGLDADVSLVKRVLEEAGHEIVVSHARKQSFFGKLFGKKRIYDLNIFMERVFPNWIPTAKKNLLIPNQERFPHRHLSRLKDIDLVLCKSKHAEEIFSAHSKSTYIGFTSKDLHLNDEIPDYQRYFHLAGRSTLKGTETLLEVWKKHPDWPKLTVLQHAHNAPEEVPENVQLITDYVPYDELIKLCNKSGVHLCPSLSEGWGHYIVEAMSCKAVVITTDAPPMNELVQPGRGICVPYFKDEPRHLGTNFHVCPERLESHIKQVLEVASEEKAKLGEAARQWFLNNHENFKERLLKEINLL